MPLAPAPLADAWLEEARALCRALIKRYLQRYWYRAAQGAGSLGDLFVTIEEVKAELEIGTLKPPLPLGSPEAVAQEITAARAALQARARQKPEPPAIALARSTRLSEEELELVVVPATLEGAPGLLRVCTFAWADFAVKQPTAGFLLELLADDAGHRHRLEAALAPDSPIRRLALVQLGEDKRWQPSTPLLLRPVMVPDAVRRYLEGRPVLDEGYPPGAVRLETEGPRPEDLILADPVRMDRILGELARREHLAPVLLIGSPGAGRRTLTRAYALKEGRPVFHIDVSAFPWELEPFEKQIAAALRDGVLTDAVTLLRCDRLGERGDRRLALLGRLVMEIGGSVALTTTLEHVPALSATLPDARSLTLDEPPSDTRTRLYATLTRKHDFALTGNGLMHLADIYKLRPGDLDRALADVRLASGDSPELDLPRFDQAVRRQVRTRLGDLATLLRTSQNWDDLIISDEQREVIEEILAHARHRTRVFEEWGFARKLGSRGRGLSCLFSGPPGTGKTMSAGLIAKELGLDLYQVDLSRIVDKYVGETEKNLARLFDEATRVPVVLLFDEADSLFANRTKVESSNDRYANLEVNFLLQRMEAYEGISILTTNLGTGIDQAFKRRLRFRMHFDLPGPDEREVLWKAMVPPGLAVDDQIDWRKLARRWEMSGALIRNAMVRAAFLAAERETSLNLDLLQQAARSELMEMGRLGS